MKHMSLLLLIGTMALAWTNMMLFESDQYATHQQGKLIGAHAHKTKQTMERFIREVFNNGKVHLIDEMVSEDYLAKSLGEESFRFEGREALREGILNAHFQHPGYKLSLDEYIAYDNRLVFYWPGGDILEGGIPLADPTAPPGHYGISIFCFEDGLLVETFFMRCNFSEFDMSPNISGRLAPADLFRRW